MRGILCIRGDAGVRRPRPDSPRDTRISSVAQLAVRSTRAAAHLGRRTLIVFYLIGATLRGILGRWPRWWDHEPTHCDCGVWFHAGRMFRNDAEPEPGFHEVSAANRDAGH